MDAAVYATQAAGFTHSLVVLAMGETCWLIPADDGHHLRVEPAALSAIQRQLACFDRESMNWPPVLSVDPAPVAKHSSFSPLFWVFAVFLVFWAQETRPEITHTGLLDAHQVFDHGEWWRIATALWLHADIGHLLSNAGSGFLVFSALVATFGLSRAWTLLAVSSLAGNFAAVAFHYGQDYRSLGASTAIFAGLGLLTGRAVRVMSRSGHPHRWRAILVPLCAGLAVLGLFGAGGVNIDVLAHATGFVSGLTLGFIAARPSRDRARES